MAHQWEEIGPGHPDRQECVDRFYRGSVIARSTAVASGRQAGKLAAFAAAYGGNARMVCAGGPPLWYPHWSSTERQVIDRLKGEYSLKELWRCGTCGMVRSSPEPPPSVPLGSVTAIPAQPRFGEPGPRLSLALIFHAAPFMSCEEAVADWVHGS